jgi:tetratricopeptide (TPR) repeat protein
MNRRTNHFSVSIAIIIFCIIPLSLRSSQQPARYHRKVDKSTILFLFQHQAFKSLNSKLEEYQSAYDKDYEEENTVYDAFDVFSKVDTAFESRLQRWINEYPDSYAPYVARAKYYCARAQKARGRKWVLNREQKEFIEMEHFYSLAFLDIDEALKKNGQLDLCYAMMIEIGAMTGNDEVKSKALSRALTHHPYAYRIRLKYAQALTPRLGGSYERMAIFIDSSKSFAAFNPKIKELSASIPADKGNYFYYLGKYGEALKMFTEALTYSTYHSYYADRGDTYVQLHDYVHALNDYDHALELSPNDPEYVSRKANAIASQTNFNNSKKAIQSTQRYSPKYDGIQGQSLVKERTQANNYLESGMKFARTGQLKEAIADFNEAIRIVPYEYAPYFNRALCYSQLHDDDAALEDFLRVVELKPDHSTAYIRMTTIYANRRMYDDALTSINKVISLDPENGEALFTRAKIYERKGSNIQALQDARQACDLGYQEACRYYNQVK